MHEGDIMIHPDSQSWKNGLLDATARWPGGVVPYFIVEDDFGKAPRLLALSPATLAIIGGFSVKLVYHFGRAVDLITDTQTRTKSN